MLMDLKGALLHCSEIRELENTNSTLTLNGTVVFTPLLVSPVADQAQSSLEHGQACSNTEERGKLFNSHFILT